MLESIHINFMGKACIGGIIISCGSELNDEKEERSVILDSSTIKERLNKQHFFRPNDSTKKCYWVSAEDYDDGPINGLDIHNKAFSCLNGNEACISKYIEVY